MRVIVVSTEDDRDLRTATARLDAQIRVGGDAGASEVIVLRAYGETASDEEGLVTGLLLPDAPVVVWWPGAAPRSPSTSPLGRIATRRITDASAQPDPQEALRHLGADLRAGRHRLRLDAADALARAARRRARPAAVRADHRASRSPAPPTPPPPLLLAAWLRLQLQVPVQHDLTVPRDRLQRHPRRAHGARIRRHRARARDPERRPAVAAGPADARPRRCPAGACATASPRNCVGWTPTTCTVR